MRILNMVMIKLILLVLKLNPESILFSFRTCPSLSLGWTRVVSLVDLMLKLSHRCIDDLLSQLLMILRSHHHRVRSLLGLTWVRGGRCDLVPVGGCHGVGPSQGFW